VAGSVEQFRLDDTAQGNLAGLMAPEMLNDAGMGLVQEVYTNIRIQQKH
jgi:hypothetical protein